MYDMIRFGFISLSLVLGVSGCARNQQVHSTSRSSPRPSARAAASPSANVATPLPSSRDKSVASGSNESNSADSQHDITLDQIRVHVNDNTAVLVDAREPDQFANGHVRGAFNVPAGDIEAYMSGIRESVAYDQLIIIYCSGPSCNSGDTVYDFLAGQGFTNLRVYSPGWRMLASAKNLR